ncbi:HK97 gp10 family phage protein [Melissococcus plutonius]|uniref:HK97-gp10 family putative phage morphogenesis protein n=1 Tax=Melissococcus plutonius TaxID=33970 RepID=UPI0021E58087|nr:HK97-gp10 family putative phage morphogenesis protein [Melissococcus plutonius]MCV2499597.1 HK97 gp10 family phage protein [Melissococcus plutonius]MCV2501517.1 HK97 gp10 family phage protein [Melissococcus plutonius]MCV2505982.1 HK97 gp10 family phage protein [Melissococcus plutonius]MCV2508223.1 HK97 gp10 family phage protein [Melissococcus plutonius]MCV2519989.1 HK97 gp10 family phage protein [Melissococcus plutonius]
MPNDGNGFSDMADYLGNLSRVDAKKVSLESLEKAANFYIEKLIPNIPKSLFKKKHMLNQVHVLVGEDDVKVMFGETAFYWRFAENGTSKQRAQHFASGTYEKYKDEIEKIMTQKIKQVWEG